MNFQFNTFGSIIDEAAAKMHIDIDSGSLPGADRSSLERDANRARKRFLSKVETNFNIKPFAVDTIGDLLVSVAADVGDVTFTTNDATGVETSGTLMVQGIEMTYTRVGNVFTVPTLTFKVEEGDVVSFGYSLPSDFLRPRTISVNGVEKDLSRKGDSIGVDSGTFIISGNTLFLPEGTTTGMKVRMYYMSASSNLSTNDILDIADFMDDYVIYHLKAVIHRCLYEEEMAIASENKANAIMREAFDFNHRISGARNQYIVPLT